MFDLLPSVVFNTLLPLQISCCRFPYCICTYVNCYCICPCAICHCTCFCMGLFLRIRQRIHPWCKLHCTILPAIHPWSNIIAQLCLWSTCGQKSSHGFAYAPFLVEGHRIIYSWPFGKSLLTNLSLHDWLPTNPRSAFPFPQLSLTLWALFFYTKHSPLYSR